MIFRIPVLFALLALSLARILPAAGEDRFDPPLEGAYLGIQGGSGSRGVRVERVERGSAADLADLEAGDWIVSLDGRNCAGGYDRFVQAVGALPTRIPVMLEVLRGQARKVLTVRPDPAILRDNFQVISVLQASPFLRTRAGYPAVLAEMEESIPAALRLARRTSEAAEILNGALGRLGTSHTAFIPAWTNRNLFAGEKDGRNAFWTGIILERVGAGDGKVFFALEVHDGGPAAAAGVLLGDEILSVNGIPIPVSPRRILAGFEASRPRYTIQIEPGERIRLEIRRDRGADPLPLELDASAPFNGLRASEASVRMLRQDGRSVAYVHLWNLLSPRAPGVLARVLGDRVRFAEGIVLDFRGRGGQVAVMSQVVGLLKEDRRPLAILMDRDTRSAKEIAAFQMRGFPTTVLVGETTAGAVLPSTLQELPSGGAVMVPGDPQGVTTLSQGEVLEGVGVRPDVEVPRAGPYAAGRDPILEAGLRSVLDRLRGEPRRQRL